MTDTDVLWDVFTRITLHLFSEVFLSGASALLSQNDEEV